MQDNEWPLYCACGRIYHSPGNRRAAPLPRPGDSLSQLLHSLGLTHSTGCGCASMVNKMNAWGVDGCLANEQAILDHLRAAWRKLTWLQAIRVAYRAILAGISPIRPFRSALRIALCKPPPTS